MYRRKSKYTLLVFYEFLELKQTFDNLLEVFVIFRALEKVKSKPTGSNARKVRWSIFIDMMFFWFF